MIYHALIPVKSLRYAKSRLSEELSAEQRRQLVMEMLDHVITMLKSCSTITRITIVTPDKDIAKYAISQNVAVLPEKSPGYNQAVSQAAVYEKNNALLTIAADMPLLTQNDIQQMLTLSEMHDVVLAPAKDNGTNAILVRPALAVPYLFGPQSFTKYQKKAEEKGLSVGVYRSKTIALDIDTRADIRLLEKIKRNRLQ